MSVDVQFLQDMLAPLITFLGWGPKLGKLRLSKCLFDKNYFY